MAESIFDSEYGVTYKDKVTIIDRDWVSNMYMTSSTGMDENFASKRVNSFGDTIYSNTSPGSSRSINPLPMSGPYVDEPASSRMQLVEKTINGVRVLRYQPYAVTVEGIDITPLQTGMGKFYSEAFAKTEQILYLKAGVPKWSSMFDYLKGLVDREELIAATTGGARGGYKFGKAVGTALMIYFFPLPYLVINGLKLLASTFIPPSSNDYYTLKEAQHNYLATVSGIITHMSVELGITSPILGKGKTIDGKVGSEFSMDQDSFKEFADYYPNMISKAGGQYYIDAYKMIFGNARDLQFRKDMFEAVRKEAAKGGTNQDMLNAFLHKGDINLDDTKDNPRSLVTFYEAVLSTFPSYQNADKKEEKIEEPIATNSPIDRVAVMAEKAINYSKDVIGYTKLAHASGGLYVPITVEYTGSTTYSFNNTTEEIGLENTFNNGSKRIEDFKYSAFGGNILGDTVKEIGGWIENAAFGAVDAATFGITNILAGMMAGSNVSLPKKIADSSVTFPVYNFTAISVAVSGHPMVQLTSNYTLMAFLLGFALPKSVGTNSYTSPYLLSAFLRGVCNVKLGVMDSLRIEYGVGNTGRTALNRPINFKITFGIVDLSEKLTAATPKPSAGPLTVRYTDGDPLSLFVRSLAGSSLYRESSSKQIFSGPALQARISRSLMDFAGKTSNARIGMFLEDLIPFSKANIYERNLTLQQGNTF